MTKEIKNLKRRLDADALKTGYRLKPVLIFPQYDSTIRAYLQALRTGCR